MQLATSRFGTLDIESHDILLFPTGIVAFEDCRNWVLLGDADSPHVAWLQSASRPEVALAVVSPRKFVPDYQVHVTKSQISTLQLRAIHEAYVLTIVGKNERGLTLNLKAPIIINLDRRLGRQVVTSNEQSLQYELVGAGPGLRKIA